MARASICHSSVPAGGPRAILVCVSHVVLPLVGLIPSALIMRAYARAFHAAQPYRRSDVPLGRVAARRSLSAAVDFANYTPEGADSVQRMRDCLLLMVLVGFPAFAIGVFA